MKINTWDKLTEYELNRWLGRDYSTWLPMLLLDMINENNPHALADLKYTIKREYQENLHKRSA